MTVIDKKIVRREATIRRNALDLQERWDKSANVCQQAIQWLQSNTHMTRIMVYVAFRSEVSLQPLIEWAFAHGIEVVVPKCVGTSLELYPITDWQTQLSAGTYGILEPDHSQVQPMTLPQFVSVASAIFVPGLLFDFDGGRMGYGGGFYDRFYAQLQEVVQASKSHMPSLIGVAFIEQIVTKVVMEQHDARMTAIVTEDVFHNVKQ